MANYKLPFGIYNQIQSKNLLQDYNTMQVRAWRLNYSFVDIIYSFLNIIYILNIIFVKLVIWKNW